MLKVQYFNTWSEQYACAAFGGRELTTRKVRIVGFQVFVWSLWGLICYRLWRRVHLHCFTSQTTVKLFFFNDTCNLAYCFAVPVHSSLAFIISLQWNNMETPCRWKNALYVILLFPLIYSGKSNILYTDSWIKNYALGYRVSIKKKRINLTFQRFEVAWL